MLHLITNGLGARLLCFRLELLDPLLDCSHDLGLVKDVRDAVLGADRLAPFAVVGQGVEAL